MKLKTLVLLSLLPVASVAWADDNVFAGEPVNGESVNAAQENTTLVAATSVDAVSQPTDDNTVYARSLNKRHIERVDRDALKATFIPKGQWMVGGTINFQQWDTESMDMLVLKNMQYNAYTFSGSPYFGYFVKNNLAIGGRYSYSRNNFQLDKFDLNLGEDFNISLADLAYIGHRHQASAFLRNYMPIGKSKIFAFFTEIDATYAQNISKNSTGRVEDKTFDGTYLKTNAVQLGFMPGMSAFITDFAAMECSIGVMGLDYKWGNATANQVETSKIQSGGASFQLNLFSVNIGMTFYL